MYMNLGSTMMSFMWCHGVVYKGIFMHFKRSVATCPFFPVTCLISFAVLRGPAMILLLGSHSDNVEQRNKDRHGKVTCSNYNKIWVEPNLYKYLKNFIWRTYREKCLFFCFVFLFKKKTTTKNHKCTLGYFKPLKTSCGLTHRGRPEHRLSSWREFNVMFWSVKAS